jgi:excisionase family DNA binding protein
LILFNLVGVDLLRLAKAAKRLGVHPVTLRQWAIDGKIPFAWVGRERRFSSIDVENMKRGGPAADRLRRVVLDVRVSGSTGQETSLQAQEAELRATASGEDVVVVRDRGSGLQENRPGLHRVLRLVADGCVSVVRVTHEDRLARFGIGWLRQLFAVSAAREN